MSLTLSYSKCSPSPCRYIKDEMRNLKREFIRAKEELKKIQSVPLVIGQVRTVAVCSLACLFCLGAMSCMHPCCLLTLMY